ncbi:Tkp3 protein [Vanderwaltozyma polyspora DSM 70294]|uniref:Tkp3 protein n=1 Tax=Vanderwaltozyma polyspora (strain ATCC 22028 / DSM 70294 / BCRC 21397 / CBS 2163 / NBRC 10782 / NRRL Y-8283 / UCD 57-17) TaxID=436907 RepID=A7TF45_VANPO|nr:Tkp3 protein [Vanderwaltozyma polyspora DSM 70294]EDO19070.1 Tkp3 protein [Vanderwaltozyma polyspora DSM 70294]
MIDPKIHPTIPPVKEITHTLTPPLNHFKEWITRSLTLKLFDPTAPTIIFTDASLTGGASIIFQPETHNKKQILFPITFLSVRFTPTQQRYSTVERELFAVLHALEKGNLLLSSEITIYTDNKGIISIGNSDRNTHPRFTKFLDLLNGHRLKWKYLPGTKNVLADYLSRFGLKDQPELDLDLLQKDAIDLPVATLSSLNLNSTDASPNSTTIDPASSVPLSTDNTNTPEITSNTTPSEQDETEESLDPNYVVDNVNSLTMSQLIQIQTLLSTKETLIPHLFSKVIDKFLYISDLLYINLDLVLYRVVIDNDYIEVATKLHGLYHCTHRVLQLAMNDQKLWNPNSNLLLLDVVKQCPRCETYQKFRDIPIELPEIRRIPVFSRWHLDFAGPLKDKDGYKYFLLAADYTSNLILVKPLREQTFHSVYEIMRAIYAIFGSPHMLITDNGRQFANAIIPQVARSLKLKYYQSSAYHPRGNSKAERSVKMIKEVLKKLDPTFTNWVTNIFVAANIVNNTKMLYGYSPREIAFGLPSENIEVDFQQAVKSLLQKENNETGEQITNQEQAHLSLMSHVKTNDIRLKMTDERIKIRELLKNARKDTDNYVPYTRGEIVYRLRVKKNTFEPTWDGPYHIEEVVAKNTYKLRDRDGKVRKATYDGSKLKPAYSFYGSAIRTAAEYTRVYGDKERKYFLKTLGDIDKYIAKEPKRD